MRYSQQKVEKFTGMYREKLAVLFNLAALYSNAALGIDRQSSTEKRKEAIHLFQKVTRGCTWCELSVTTFNGGGQFLLRVIGRRHLPVHL